MLLDLVFPEFMRRLASGTAKFAVSEARRRMNSGKTKSIMRQSSDDTSPLSALASSRQLREPVMTREEAPEQINKKELQRLSNGFG